jgi:hypothetical protein
MGGDRQRRCSFSWFEFIAYLMRSGKQCFWHSNGPAAIKVCAHCSLPLICLANL